MQARFEEKTFESYFNTELDRRSSIYFPLGQVQEGGVGADASCFSRSRWLWRRLGYPYRTPFRGADLREMADEMERFTRREIKNIPGIKTNLLLQYKRPEFITSKRGTEWPYWNQRYFRYDLYAEQQKLLEHLSSKFGSKALVLYASPAIADVNELVRAKQKSSLIESTNFRPAVDLAGHHRNTYVNAGTHSIACSEPTSLESFDLLRKLDGMESSRLEVDAIVDFAAQVRKTVEKDPVLGRPFRLEIRPYIEAGTENYPLSFALISMGVFRELSGTQWLLVSGD